MDKKLKYDVYLSIGMHGRQVASVLLQIGIAKMFCKKYGLTYYAPTDDEGLDQLSPSSIIDASPDIQRMKCYVTKDDQNVDRCRTLLLLTGNTSSSGTLWEMGRMFYKHKRPIIVVSPMMYHEKLTNYTTVKASYILETIEEAVITIKEILRRKKKCPTLKKVSERV